MSEVILQSTFSRILTFSGWPGWLNANGYKYAMLYLDANIKDACYMVGSRGGALGAEAPPLQFNDIHNFIYCSTCYLI